MGLFGRLFKKAKKEISWRNVERLVKREKKEFMKEYGISGDTTIDELLAAILDKALHVEQKLKAFEGKMRWLEQELEKRN